MSEDSNNEKKMVIDELSKKDIKRDLIKYFKGHHKPIINDVVESIATITMFDDELANDINFINEFLNLINISRELTEVKRHFNIPDDNNKLIGLLLPDHQNIPDTIKEDLTKENGIIKNDKDNILELYKIKKLHSFINNFTNNSPLLNSYDDFGIKNLNNNESDIPNGNHDNFDVKKFNIKDRKYLLYNILILGEISRSVIQGSDVVIVYDTNNSKEERTIIKTICEEQYNYKIQEIYKNQYFYGCIILTKN
jgi:hypothetical protein